MPFVDYDLPILEQYKPPRVEQADFDAFWQRTLSEARQYPLNATFVPADFGMTAVETFDVTFSGYGGQPIKAWLIMPKHRSGKLPCIVEYLGYGGGRGFPTVYLKWACAGYAHLLMDTRGQGSRWQNGDTPDPEPEGTNPQHPGFMTRGVLNPNTYYYRRVFTDGVRAVEAAASHPDIDASRIIVTGGSQGGGITIAVASLSDQVIAAMPDVPFLCHYRRATQLINTDPYTEITMFCRTHRDKVEQVFTTLSYFDGVNMGTRAKVPALFSVALMDDICPASTVYAAFNHYAGQKQIVVWEYNNHEGGGIFQFGEQQKFLKNVIGISTAVSA